MQIYDGKTTAMNSIPDVEYEARGPALAVIEAWWAQRLAITPKPA